MRPITTEQEDVLFSNHYRVDVKLQVNTSRGSTDYNDLRDLAGANWISRIEIERSMDNSAGSFKAWLVREVSSSQSIAPLRNDSTLNQTSTGGPRSLIDVGREAKIWVSTVPASCSLLDWQLVFEGEIDSWDARSNPMLVRGRDQAGVLLDQWIEPSTIILGASTGTPVETVIQTILTDHSTPAPTLTVPASPGFAVIPYTQAAQPVMHACKALADLPGWDIRYRWSTTNSTFELTFYEPSRSSTTPDSTFDASRYVRLPRVVLARDDIRNVVKVWYQSSTVATDAAKKRSVEVESTASQEKYGRRWMELTEASSSYLTKSSEATDLANSILSDYQDPEVEQEVDMHLFWPVELNDLYRFEPNDVHYEASQDLAVKAFRHEISQDRHRTVMRLSGKPIAGPKIRSFQGVAAEVFDLSVRYSLTGFPIITFEGNGACETVYITVGYDAVPADPTVAANDGFSNTTRGTIFTATTPALMGQDIIVKAVGINEAGQLGAVFSVAFIRGDSHRHRPFVQAQTSRSSGETATFQVDAVEGSTDTAITRLEYKTKIDDGALDALWQSSCQGTDWTSRTGEIGASVLQRTKDVTVSEGKDSQLIWRLTYTDENGVSQTIGDSVELGNLEEVSKTLRISSPDFIPHDGRAPWRLRNSSSPLGMLLGVASSTSADASSDWGGLLTAYRPVTFPIGVNLTAMRARVLMNVSTLLGLLSTADVELIAFNDTPTSSTLANIAFSTSGNQTGSASLSETISSDLHYAARFHLNDETIRAEGQSGLYWVEFDYDMPGYKNTY